MEFPEDLKVGEQIACVPDHADGDINHPAVENGFVTSNEDDAAFCRYFYRVEEGYSGFHSPPLRTRANSELTSKRHLRRHQHTDQHYVNGICEALDYKSEVR